MRRDVTILRSFRQCRASSRGVAARMVMLATFAASSAIAGSACTSAQLAGQSSAYLIIDSLKAASGAKPAEMSGTLASDVQTIKDNSAGWYEDPGQVTFSLALKDPGSSESPAQPSSTNFITVNRYRVQYVRADGRNTQGVDVPYAFDGAFTATVNSAGAIASLILVREQAKLEAPLLALRNGGGAIAISTIAQVTFYGHDQAGHDVSVVGYISVNFADWADPQ